MELHGEDYNHPVPGPVDILHVPCGETKKTHIYLIIFIKKKSNISCHCNNDTYTPLPPHPPHTHTRLTTGSGADHHLLSAFQINCDRVNLKAIHIKYLL